MSVEESVLRCHPAELQRPDCRLDEKVIELGRHLVEVSHQKSDHESDHGEVVAILEEASNDAFE